MGENFKINQRCQRGRCQGVKGRVLDEPFFQNLEAQICACSFLQPCNIYQGCRKEQAQICAEGCEGLYPNLFCKFCCVSCVFLGNFGNSVVLVKLVY